MEEVMRERILKCLKDLPVTVNTSYGDGFTPPQWDNTISKLKYLKEQGHTGEIEITSKWILNDDQIEELYSINPDLWIHCGITGINETDSISLEQRFDHYLRICEKFRHTVVSIRPLIPGINDSLDVIKPMIKIAAEGRKLMHQGGYKNPMDPSRVRVDNNTIESLIKEECDKEGVTITSKCSCLHHIVEGRVCCTHSTSDPVNLDILQLMGFDYKIADGEVELLGFKGSNRVTRGDVNFCRHIIMTSRIKQNWTDSSQVMQVKGLNGQPIVCTSSFYNWSRELDTCMIGCWYCMARPGTKTAIVAGDFGCSPADLFQAFFEEGK